MDKDCITVSDGTVCLLIKLRAQHTYGFFSSWKECKEFKTLADALKSADKGDTVFIVDKKSARQVVNTLGQYV